MARTPSTNPPIHARLHKRTTSIPSVASPTASPAMAKTWHTPRAVPSRKDAREEIIKETKGRDDTYSAVVKIKPYLRKLSTKDDGGLDLSRPAAENEKLAGLGIYETDEFPRSVSDVSFAPVGRQRHRRSTSNTSQFSSSSGHRASLPYVHPLRQTPRPYTPPIVPSYANSTYDANEDDEADDTIMCGEEFRMRQHRFDTKRRSGSLSSASAVPPSLTLHNSQSLTRLGSASQSTVSVASPPVGGRPRGDTGHSFDSVATSPTSRPSLDKFSFLRKDTPLDPTTRAHEIHLAREAFKEKQMAKEQQKEKEALRQADRDARKHERKQEREQRKGQGRSMSISNEKDDSTIVIGREYDGYRPAHVRSMPSRVDTGLEGRNTYAAPPVTKTKQARSRWMAFIVWFRTRLLRVGRKMG